jgi:hypothetical protein
MARSFNGSGDRIRFGAPDTSWTVGTVSFRFKHTSTSVMTMVALEQDNGRNGFAILANPFSVGRIYVEGYPGTSPAAVSIATSGTPAANDGVYHHCGFCWNFAASSTNKFYYDATDQGANSGSGAAWGWAAGDITEQIAIGEDYGPFYSDYNGSIADFALWDVQLNADEIAALSKGVSPNRIRPTALQMHVPLVRDVRDLRGRSVASLVGGTVVDHPRLVGGAV